jgi:dolichol-phosphate mannosyltransferase
MFSTPNHATGKLRKAELFRADQEMLMDAADVRLTDSLAQADWEVSMRPIELTVVVPAFNERQNVPILLEKLEGVLAGVEWEAIFLDDHSPDDTSDVVHGIAHTNRRVRSIERIGRRVLSPVCIEGMMASTAPYIAMMDAPTT